MYRLARRYVHHEPHCDPDKIGRKNVPWKRADKYKRMGMLGAIEESIDLRNAPSYHQELVENLQFKINSSSDFLESLELINERIKREKKTTGSENSR